MKPKLNLEDILKNKGLSLTDSRIEVLKIFNKKTSATSLKYINKKLKDSFDRVTVYRTLKTFTDAGIIHKVLDDEGNIQYALCKDSCKGEKHNHEHVHFKCMKCEETNCINEIQIPFLKLPKGFVVYSQDLLILGTCKKCNERILGL